MRLLHGSNTEITVVDLLKCKTHNDFGRGFYLTPSWQRAWEMGRRRKKFYGGEIKVNAFLYSPSEARNRGLRILEFTSFTVKWARFVILNRESHTTVHDYDIVIGPVADAVFDRVLAQYKAEKGDRYLEDDCLQDFVSRVSQFGLNYKQYCFCSERAIEILHKD